MWAELASIFFLFFKIGLFTVGGGYAIVPLIQQELISRGLITPAQAVDLVAIAEMTPGPFAINTATFTGMRLYGLLGAAVATLGMTLPSIIICLIVARFFFHINDKPQVRSVLLGIRPVVLALILSALISILNTSLFPMGTFLSFEWPVLIIAAVAAVLLIKTKLHPVLLLIAAGVVGAVFLH